MRCFPFIFEATTYCYDPDEHRGHTYKVAGVGSCTNFTDAVSQIEKEYGEDLASIERLESIGEYKNTDKTIIAIKKEWVKEFITNDFLDLGEEVINET